MIILINLFLYISLLPLQKKTLHISRCHHSERMTTSTHTSYPRLAKNSWPNSFVFFTIPVLISITAHSCLQLPVFSYIIWIQSKHLMLYQHCLEVKGRSVWVGEVAGWGVGHFKFHHSHPDINYCPFLPSVASLLLHSVTLFGYRASIWCCISTAWKSKVSMVGDQAGRGCGAWKLYYTHPDINYCPFLPSVASLLLHYMDTEQAFDVVSALLGSQRLVWWGGS